jgi:hypothetical protein
MCVTKASTRFAVERQSCGPARPSGTGRKQSTLVCCNQRLPCIFGAPLFGNHTGCDGAVRSITSRGTEGRSRRRARRLGRLLGVQNEAGVQSVAYPSWHAIQASRYHRYPIRSFDRNRYACVPGSSQKSPFDRLDAPASTRKHVDLWLHRYVRSPSANGPVFGGWTSLKHFS